MLSSVRIIDSLNSISYLDNLNSNAKQQAKEEACLRKGALQ